MTIDETFYRYSNRARAKIPEWGKTSIPQGEEAVSMGKLLRAVFLEYLATTLFVFYACGSVLAGQQYTPVTAATVVLAGLMQGFAIATFVYAISHTSGGHINPAVTFSLTISGHIGVFRAFFYIFFQIAGGITGAALLDAVIPSHLHGNLGTTTPSMVSHFQAFLIEFIITFALIFTIFGTALNKEASATGLQSLAPLPIGFSILIGVSLAFAFTGGSMNPARTFGPALISGTWTAHYVYWAGPLGAGLVIGMLERYVKFFSAGQKHVRRSRRERKKRLFKQAHQEIFKPQLPLPVAVVPNEPHGEGSEHDDNEVAGNPQM